MLLSQARIFLQASDCGGSTGRCGSGTRDLQDQGRKMIGYGRCTIRPKVGQDMVYTGYFLEKVRDRL